MIQTPDPRLQGLPVYRRTQRRARGAILWTAALATFVVAALVLVLTMATPAPSVAGTVPAGFDLTSDAEPAPGMGAATTTTPASEAVAERPAASIADVGPVLPADSAVAERSGDTGTAIETPVVQVPVVSGTLTGASTSPAPVRLRIPALGIDAPIDGVGVDGAAMDIPASAGVVAWYEFGPRPGEQGSAVLAAHVDWGGRRGVFFELDEIPPGAIVDVVFDDGAIRRFEVVELTSYDKDDLPVADIFRRDGDAIVTLITCGGAFNPSLRSYEDNIVAYARELTSPVR